MTRSSLYDNFTPGPDRHWRRLLVGKGSLEPAGDTLRLANDGASAHTYSNAQIDDYQHLARRRFPWRPPLTLTVRARFSHPAAARPGDWRALTGTAGFGFWNDPFLMTGLRWPTLPRAIWFFYASPPSDMKLDCEVPGWGWKAAVVDAAQLPFYLLALAAPIAIPLMNVRSLYRRLWPAAQRTMGVREALMDVEMGDWHIYHIEWGSRLARFSVDGRAVMVTDRLPRGPMGLVIWLDNQYLVATPWGKFAHGYLAKREKQWLELDWVAVESTDLARRHH